MSTKGGRSTPLVQSPAVVHIHYDGMPPAVLAQQATSGAGLEGCLPSGLTASGVSLSRGRKNFSLYSW